MITTKGVYYIPKADKIVILSRVEVYEDLWSKFAIVTWCAPHADFPKTLITKDQFKDFKRIGEL